MFFDVCLYAVSFFHWEKIVALSAEEYPFLSVSKLKKWMITRLVKSLNIKQIVFCWHSFHQYVRYNLDRNIDLYNQSLVLSIHSWSYYYWLYAHRDSMGLMEMIFGIFFIDQTTWTPEWIKEIYEILINICRSNTNFWTTRILYK